MGEQLSVRASDEDREHAASEIREHFAQGRLNSDELAERLERAYAAQTTGDLHALRADLPEPSPSPMTRRPDIAARRSQLGRQLIQRTGAALTPFLICTLVWLFSGAQGGFWPVWVILVAVIPLVRNGWQLYGPAPELDRVSDDLESQAQQPRSRP